MPNEIILIEAAAKPDEPMPSDADYRQEIQVDFSKAAVQFGTICFIFGLGLLGIVFVSWLRDIR